MPQIDARAHSCDDCGVSLRVVVVGVVGIVVDVVTDTNGRRRRRGSTAVRYDYVRVRVNG